MAGNVAAHHSSLAGCDGILILDFNLLPLIYEGFQLPLGAIRERELHIDLRNDDGDINGEQKHSFDLLLLNVDILLGHLVGGYRAHNIGVDVYGLQGDRLLGVLGEQVKGFFNKLLL